MKTYKTTQFEYFLFRITSFVTGLLAKVITDKFGDYLLAVKSNQGKLRKAVEKAFSKERANLADTAAFEEGHGPG
ncbi:hypothetical protein F8B77_14415 [Aliivibrio finisterrensis]|uniref:Uncharacterized protein n=1 Tax=Aliivibrio finisterrensis TaxID=511998 RepID=A0A6N6RQ76_9GAMM|nr:hypothetical protein F8B77_14415 [Aliivibrio finisterrensis]